MIYNRAQIAAAWCEAGGDPTCATMAAAVALAESNGNTEAADLADHLDPRFGLWQAPTTSPASPPVAVLATLLGAAEEAIRRSDNGRNWRLFRAYRLGAYMQFLPPGPRIPINNENHTLKWSTHFRVNSRAIQVEIRRHSGGVKVTITAGRVPLYPTK